MASEEVNLIHKFMKQFLSNFLPDYTNCNVCSTGLFINCLDLITLAMKPKLALYPASLDGRKRRGHEIETFTGTVGEEVQKIAFEVKNRLQVEKIEAASI